MKNLENYGVQEISLNDKSSIDGGFWLMLLRAAAISFAGDAANNYKSSWGALKAGFEAGDDANNVPFF